MKDKSRMILDAWWVIPTVVVSLILLGNTNPDPNAEIRAPTIENTIVTCEFTDKTVMNFPATSVYREGKSLHIKHPESSFVLQDPDSKCRILQ